jgi:hypothetical protein
MKASKALRLTLSVSTLLLLPVSLSHAGQGEKHADKPRLIPPLEKILADLCEEGAKRAIADALAEGLSEHGYCLDVLASVELYVTLMNSDGPALLKLMAQPRKSEFVDYLVLLKKKGVAALLLRHTKEFQDRLRRDEYDHFELASMSIHMEDTREKSKERSRGNLSAHDLLARARLSDKERDSVQPQAGPFSDTESLVPLFFSTQPADKGALKPFRVRFQMCFFAVKDGKGDLRATSLTAYLEDLDSKSYYHWQLEK